MPLHKKLKKLLDSFVREVKRMKVVYDASAAPKKSPYVY